MESLLEITTYATSVGFLFLAILSIRRWRLDRTEAGRWAALAFSFLALVTLGSLVDLSRVSGFEEVWVTKVTIACVVLFPYFLYRFARSFAPLPRWLDGFAMAITAGVIIWGFVVPTLPTSNTNRPGWLMAFLLGFLAQWTILSAVASTRLWRAGSGQGALPRRRMRVMSLGAIGLTLAILIAVAAPTGSMQLAQQLLALGCAITFILGFSPPRFVREMWRRPEQEKLEGAIQALMSATTTDQIASVLLPQVAAMVGASGAALFDPNGKLVAAHRNDDGSSDETEDEEPVDSVEAGSHRIELGGVGSLVVSTSPYTPYFGRDEFALLQTLGSLAQIAFQRAWLFDSEQDARDSLAKANFELDSANKKLRRENFERKAVEEEMRRSKTFLDSIVENIPDMIFVKDAKQLRFVSLNKAGEELLGYSREELIGKGDHDFFPEEEAEFFVSNDRMVLEGMDAVDIPAEEIQTRNLGPRILHTKKIPIRDERGEAHYLLGISEDVTERKQAVDALRKARDEADRANRAKSDFVSRMSHELRTPLNAILGFTQLLELDHLDAEQRDNVTRIIRAGKHLLQLINEVLEISRMETGDLSLSIEPVSVATLVEESIDLVAPLSDDRGVRVDSKLAATVDVPHVMGDHQRLKQVLINLLSNGIKYNHEGGSVTVTCEPAADGRIRLDVADTGPGIPESAFDRLFAPFDRLGANENGVEGTGLGLALSKHLVEAVGGRLEVASAVGKGSVFSMLLDRVEGPAEPVEPTRKRDDDEHQPGAGAEGTVLCIEDNISNLKLLERVLRRRPGIVLLPAMQGGIGFDMAAENDPDLILLDLNLPDLNGKEVLAKLKSDPRTRHIPVMVLSADATASQIQRLLDSGASGYITKPFDISELLATLDRCLGVASRVS